MRTRSTTRCRSRLIGPIALLLLVAAAAGPAASDDASERRETITPADVQGPMTWGAATRVTRLHHLFFADQPDAAGFEAAKAAGVVAVIDLRAPGERDWDERAVVEGLGLAYANVPVTGDAFDPEAFERIEALVAERHPAKILVHCSTSNRVGGWLATHLVTHHGLAVDDAIAVGRRAGITNDAIEQRARDYLAARATE